MNYSMIRYILSSVICFEGIFLLLPAATAGIYQEKEGFLYLIIGLACMLIGFWGRRRKPKQCILFKRRICSSCIKLDNPQSDWRIAHVFNRRISILY